MYDLVNNSMSSAPTSLVQPVGRWRQALAAMKRHWPEYLMEAAGLGIFMVAACIVTIVLQHPSSPVRNAIDSSFLRGVLTGIAMGLTNISIVYSPWGKQSGAHLNPALTLTFFWLGKIAPWDALGYIAAQFVGGLTGVLVASLAVGALISDPAVHYAATVPGPGGPWIAFAAELAISFLMMTVVLTVSNTERLARFTGLFAGALVAIYISLEAPLSGMSMNPARTFASALPEWLWTALWVYFTAPPLGMLLAAQVRLWVNGRHSVDCAKLHHQNDKRCIFCAYQKEQGTKS